MGWASCWSVGNENFLHLVKLMRLGLAWWRPRENAGFGMEGVGISGFPRCPGSALPRTFYRLSNLV